MTQEFVTKFKGLRKNDKIKIVDECLPFGTGIPVPNSYLKYIKKCGNCFTVKNIYIIGDDNAMIDVYEVSGSIDFYQVEICHNFNPRVINFNRSL